MDSGLFQVLALFLLLGILLTMFGVLQSLGGIRRALEGDRPAAAAPDTTAPAAIETAETAAEPATDESSDESPLTWAHRTEEEVQPAAESSEPATSSEATAAEEPETATPSEEATAAAPVLYGDAGLATATPAAAALETPEPEETAEPEDPQDQPFERDGRWWFRRGDELLVYEEQTGQWIAAEEPSKSGSVAAGAPAGAETDAAAEPGGSGAAGGQVTTQLEAAPTGTFWKCPSCGAVNGSTATSCRMCFTARP